MLLLSPLVKLLARSPVAKKLGKFYSSGESGFGVARVDYLLQPEQILSRTPQGKVLYETALEEKRIARGLTEEFTKRKDNILKKYNITTPEQQKQMIDVIEFPWYNKRLPTSEDLAPYGSNILRAAMAHQKEVVDPIWKIAKSVDPEIGKITGYFTHSPSTSKRRQLSQEIQDTRKLLNVAKDENQAAELQAHLSRLDERLRKVEKVDATLASQRYGVMPSGGKFGPLDNARLMEKEWNYKLNYDEVMNDYISGAMRKVFLDRFMPRATNLVHSIGDPFVNSYAFDYVMSLRGVLGTKARTSLHSSMSQLFGDPDLASQRFSKSVDFITKMQYLTKIGLSWFRFPFVNMTQPMLTTFPLVGARPFVKAYVDAFSWAVNPTKRSELAKYARSIGAVTETDIRRAISEYLGQRKLPHFLAAAEKAATWPAFASEVMNRLITVSAGRYRAAELGIKDPTQVAKFVRKLVHDTQFLYQKEAMPLAMSYPMGRVIGQFRTFTANYVNFLTKLFRNAHNDPDPLIRALGSLGVLSGTSMFPMWDVVRQRVLRMTGFDLGETNPIEFASDKMGLTPGINLGMSLEPFNFPRDAYVMLGPTLGLLAESGQILMFGSPDELDKWWSRLGYRFAPPVSATIKGVRTLAHPLLKEVGVQKEPPSIVRMPPTKTRREGRVVGKRPWQEMIFMRPRLESVRNEYIRLIASALYAGNTERARELREEGKRKGLKLDAQDWAQAEAMATKWKGVK